MPAACARPNGLCKQIKNYHRVQTVVFLFRTSSTDGPKRQRSKMAERCTEVEQCYPLDIIPLCFTLLLTPCLKHSPGFRLYFIWEPFEITAMNSRLRSDSDSAQSLKDDMNSSALKQYLRTVATPSHPPRRRNRGARPCAARLLENAAANATPSPDCQSPVGGIRVLFTKNLP